ncbi:MAG TPA: YceI family protein [Thermoanaerobaculia bacterium]
MRKFLLAITTGFFALATGFFAVTGAAPTTYRVEPVNATVAFSITKWGLLVEEGAFRDFTGNVTYDAKNPERSQASFSVRTASIDTKNSDRDDTLRSDDFLHAARHPQLTFKSTRVVPLSSDTARVTGDLTIRGVTRSITISVRLLGRSHQPDVGDLAAFETSFEIDRRHFGVLGSRWSAPFPGILGKTVKVRIVAGGVRR